VVTLGNVAPSELRPRLWLCERFVRLKEYALTLGLNKKLFALHIDPCKTIVDLPPNSPGPGRWLNSPVDRSPRSLGSGPSRRYSGGSKAAGLAVAAPIAVLDPTTREHYGD